MVGVPGDERWNTSPPSLALVMLTLWLVGLALLLRPWVLRRKRGRLVAGANRVVLTVFLWHVSAVALAAMVLYPLGFPEPNIGTAAWWALRPVWMALLVPPLVLLVVLFRRFELHPQPDLEGDTEGTLVRYVAAGIAVVSIGLGVLGFGVTGFNRIAQNLGEGVLGFDLNPLQNVLHLVLGLVVLWSAYREARLALGCSALLSLSFLTVGLIGIADGIEILGMNSATAVLHVVLGALGLGLVGLVARPNLGLGPPRRYPPPGRAGRI
jgi:hypothetical protein